MWDTIGCPLPSAGGGNLMLFMSLIHFTNFLKSASSMPASVSNALGDNTEDDDLDEADNEAPIPLIEEEREMSMSKDEWCLLSFHHIWTYAEEERENTLHLGWNIRFVWERYWKGKHAKVADNATTGK